MDRSAAQKLVDPAIRRGITLQEVATRIENARADSIVLGALPADEDIDLDEISRQAQDNTKTITSLQQRVHEDLNTICRQS